MDEINVFMLLPQTKEKMNNKTLGTIFFRYWTTGSMGWEGLSPRETWGKPSDCFDFLCRGSSGAVVQRENTYKEHSGHKYEETEIKVCGGRGGYNLWHNNRERLLHRTKGKEICRGPPRLSIWVLISACVKGSCTKLGKALWENRRLKNFQSSHMAGNTLYYHQPKMRQCR